MIQVRVVEFTSFSSLILKIKWDEARKDEPVTHIDGGHESPNFFTFAFFSICLWKTLIEYVMTV